MTTRRQLLAALPAAVLCGGLREPRLEQVPPPRLLRRRQPTHPGGAAPRYVTPERPIDPRPQRVLVVGDSMIHTLLPVIADHCLENHHRLHAGIWLGSTSTGWADGDKLSELLPTYDPTFVIVVLGSSEVLGYGIDDFVTRAATHLVARVARRHLAWVGPLPWHPGKLLGERLARANRGVDELNQTLRRVLGPGRHFLPSREDDIERAEDGIHPSRTGGRVWAERFVTWLRDESAHPIVLRPASRPAPMPTITRYGAAWIPG